MPHFSFSLQLIILALLQSIQNMCSCHIGACLSFQQCYNRGEWVTHAEETYKKLVKLRFSVHSDARDLSTIIIIIQFHIPDYRIYRYSRSRPTGNSS